MPLAGAMYVYSGLVEITHSPDGQEQLGAEQCVHSLPLFLLHSVLHAARDWCLLQSLDCKEVPNLNFYRIIEC